MTYADYEFYKDAYLGTAIDEKDYDRLALRASSFLDYYTQGRAAKNPELPALKMACCALAEQYQFIDTAQAVAQKNLAYSMESIGPEAASESVGAWSKSFRSGGESAAAALGGTSSVKDELANIVRQYLAGTGLLYRGGCGRCRCSPMS